jgi:hypothetical protein
VALGDMFARGHEFSDGGVLGNDSRASAIGLGLCVDADSRPSCRRAGGASLRVPAGSSRTQIARTDDGTRSFMYQAIEVASSSATAEDVNDPRRWSGNLRLSGEEVLLEDGLNEANVRPLGLPRRAASATLHPHFLGRVGGVRISPCEVEDALTRHPAALAAFAFPARHRDLGEAVGVAIALRHGQSASLHELLHVAHGGLPSEALPAALVYVSETAAAPFDLALRGRFVQQLGLPELPASSTTWEARAGALQPVDETLRSSTGPAACSETESAMQLVAVIARAWMPSADAPSMDTPLMEAGMTSVMIPRFIKVRTPRHCATTAQDASALAQPDFTTALDPRCAQDLAAAAGTQLPSTLWIEHATARAIARRAFGAPCARLRAALRPSLREVSATYAGFIVGSFPSVQFGASTRPVAPPSSDLCDMLSSGGEPVTVQSRWEHAPSAEHASCLRYAEQLSAQVQPRHAHTQRDIEHRNTHAHT